MFHLQNEFKKFRQTIHDFQLEKYISLYDRTDKQLITIDKIAIENKFGLQAIKTMYIVFRNYCLLNEKVYKKLVQNELNTISQYARLNSIANKFQRKLQESMGSIQHMYETTFRQNKQNKQILQTGLNKLQTDVQTKANSKDLDSVITKLIISYDQGHLNAEVQATEENTFPLHITEIQQNLNFNTDKTSTKKKKGKVNYEDHYQFKQEQESLMKKVQQDIKQIYHLRREDREKTNKVMIKLQTLQDGITDHKNAVQQLRNQQRAQRVHFIQQIDQLDQKINSKLSQNQWNRRFTVFQHLSVDPLKEVIKNLGVSLRADLKKYRQQTYLKINKLDIELSQNVNELYNLKAKINADIQHVAVLQMSYKQTYNRVNQEYEQIKQHVEGFIAEYTKNNKQFQKHIRKEASQTRVMITKLSNTVQEKASKALNKRIQKQFKIFSTDLMDSRQIIQNLTSNSAICSEQIKNIKQILAKKANYTDMVHYIQNKNAIQEIKQKDQQSLSLHNTSIGNNKPSVQNSPVSKILNQQNVSIEKLQQPNTNRSYIRSNPLNKQFTENLAARKTQRSNSRVSQGKSNQQARLFQTINGKLSKNRQMFQHSSLDKQEQNLQNSLLNQSQQEQKKRSSSNKNIASGLNASQRKLMLRSGRKKQFNSNTSLKNIKKD